MTEEFASTRFDVKTLDLPLRDNDFDALEELLGAGSESGGAEFAKTNRAMELNPVLALYRDDQGVDAGVVTSGAADDL